MVPRKNKKKQFGIGGRLAAWAETYA